jgi:lipopolysaccharide biosynthesis protein
MKFIKTDLVPVYQLAPAIGLIGDWQAEGMDPQFEISSKSKPLSLSKGYYIIEITNNDGLENLYNPVLFYDNGSGYCAEHQVPLVFQHVDKDVYRAYFVIPQKSLALRFDPTELHAKFNISSFKLMSCVRAEWYLSASKLVVTRKRRQGVSPVATLKRAVRHISDHGFRQTAARLRASVGIAGSNANENAGLINGLNVTEYSRDTSAYKLLELNWSDAYFANYCTASSVAEGFRSPDYATDRSQGVDGSLCDVKLIAYYLPQFHPFAENDEWWGKGFTEWTNVTKAVPRFVGHYQPKLPSDLGFYDLRNVETMRDQAEMAKKFGISGFCFHFYWFGGKRLMETPILNFLATKDIDFNYSLCWANENWSRRWDGAEHELLIGQKHSPEDDLAFLKYVSKYFADPRYIKIDGKPVLTIYRPDILPDAKATVARWRAAVKKLGFPGIYLVATNSFGFSDYGKYGFDALSEFPPHALESEVVNHKITKYDSRYAGGVFDYQNLVKSQIVRKKFPKGVVFPGVMPAWDNVARRPLAGHVFHNSSPAAYRDWLMSAIGRARQTNPVNQRIVMINAWNEWAEGAFLEPDRLNGYSYLWATASAIESSSAGNGSARKLQASANTHNKKFVAAGTHAIAAHLYYQDTVDDLAESLKGKKAIDVYITIPETADVAAFRRLTKLFPRSYIMPVSNCGRDVLPFIKLLQVIRKHSYEWICKVHGKKSLHLSRGSIWRRELFDMLFEGLVMKGSKQSHALLPYSKDVGMVGPAGSLKSLNDSWTVQNNKHSMDQILGKLNFNHFASDYTKHSFFAGTMFWFRPAALDALVSNALSDEDFGVELGRVDGTPAHAMERLFGVISAAGGYKITEMANKSSVSVDISLAKRDRK